MDEFKKKTELLCLLWDIDVGATRRGTVVYLVTPPEHSPQVKRLLLRGISELCEPGCVS